MKLLNVQAVQSRYQKCQAFRKAGRAGWRNIKTEGRGHQNRSAGGVRGKMVYGGGAAGMQLSKEEAQAQQTAAKICYGKGYEMKVIGQAATADKNSRSTGSKAGACART